MLILIRRIPELVQVADVIPVYIYIWSFWFISVFFRNISFRISNASNWL